MKIAKESDALRKKYRDLVRVTERLLRKYAFGHSPGQDQVLQSRLNQILVRQGQIVKELEECTDVQITCPTIEETLNENNRIQDQEEE